MLKQEIGCGDTVMNSLFKFTFLSLLSLTILPLANAQSAQDKSDTAIQTDNFPDPSRIVLPGGDATKYKQSILTLRKAVEQFGDLVKMAKKGKLSQYQAELVGSLEIIRSNAKVIHVLSKRAKNDTVMKLASQLLINDDVAGKLIINDDIAGKLPVLRTVAKTLSKLMVNLENIKLVVKN
jgi:hypothetical protein